MVCPTPSRLFYTWVSINAVILNRPPVGAGPALHHVATLSRGSHLVWVASIGPAAEGAERTVEGLVSILAPPTSACAAFCALPFWGFTWNGGSWNSGPAFALRH